MFTDCWLLGIWQLVVVSNISTNSSSFWWSNGMTKAHVFLVNHFFAFFLGIPRFRQPTTGYPVVPRGTCSHQWSEAATPNHAAFHHSSGNHWGNPQQLISGNGISRVNPLVTGVITHLLSGMSHQAGTLFFHMFFYARFICLPIPTDISAFDSSCQ